MNTTFKIHNAFVSGVRLDCDLTPTAHFDVHGGTKEMCARILADLGVTADVEEFATESFCTPYFAFSDGSFRDRFRHAVHLSMRLSTQPAPIATHTLFTTTARDASASRDVDPFWTVHKVVLIGDFTHEKWGLSTVQSLVERLGGERTVRRGSKLTQVRIDLGEHDVSNDEDELLATHHALERVADSVDFQKTMFLMLPGTR